ncbi:hypothetical protein [Candidatus Tisiphia endosymbiont of Hybos culiciformis]|uniref:hypothetical protein n=1 Tax=Candidatus Tisiphia endosymbiont of Hybos culiciformis TaxID=3139331 RepID=UPI003CCAFE1F
MPIGLGDKNITIVSCHSHIGRNLDTCFRKVNTKFVSPNSIGFTIILSKDDTKQDCFVDLRFSLQ